jgi:beta-glucosidase-like glycosyl hydrolase
LEVPSEDPTLAGKLAAAMTHGIQERSSQGGYIKLLGALKHFTACPLLLTPFCLSVNRGAAPLAASTTLDLTQCMRAHADSMEHSDGVDRGGFSPTIAKHDMADSYLPAYRIGIVEGGALGMMCSYTTVNNTAMCESAEWQQQWARQKLGFRGNIVTDCTALNMKGPSPESKMDAAHNAAKAVLAGTTSVT